MKSSPSLSALLSQVLVAFVIEFDNEFERQVPHRTTKYGATGDPRKVPWLVSMPVWFRFLRFVPAEGVTIGELQTASGFDRRQMKIWLTRVSNWWSYVSVEPNGVIRPAQGGEKALRVWSGLSDVIEERWAERFGQPLADLRNALSTVVKQLDLKVFSNVHTLRRDRPEAPLRISSNDRSVQILPVLLGNMLEAFETEYEEQAKLELALSANLLRVIEGQGVRIRDLPRLTGISKEATALLLKSAEKRGYVIVESENRAQILKLTSRGTGAREKYAETAAAIERRWRPRFGENVIAELRRSLEVLTIASDGGKAPIFRALEGYPEGWRANLAMPEVLPHFPMISHRGGFPDGS